MDRKIVISKSRYLKGLQCLKYLWYLVNDRKAIPQPDFVTRFIFSQGIQVGEYAKKLYPGGVDPGKIRDFKEQIEATRRELSGRKVIFEASCSCGNVYVRADILVPAEKDSWDIVEVKSSTQLKEEYIHDVAFQRYCFEKSGVKIRKCYVSYIDRQYVKIGDVRPEELFTRADITEEVSEAAGMIEKNLREMLEIVKEENPPDVLIGRHCDNPYSCPLKDMCWEFLPDNNVFTLYGDKKRAEELFSKGVLSIEDIEDRYGLSLKQQMQIDSARNGKPLINKREIKKFINSLKYPLYYFDFETFSTAIPLYNGTGPYENIPFQYSIHVQESINDKPRHLGFLAEGLEDPRGKLLSSLKKHLGTSGSIIVYYEQFEKGILRGLSEAFPEYGPWIDSILKRIVDLYRPFKNFHYYNPAQKGSASVKSVLPAITDLSYGGMDIADGRAASVSFLYINGKYDSKGDLPGKDEAEGIRKSLIRYCGMDTGGMVHILRALVREAG
ncbi:MAG: DUF2779 domain-containing protein [Actinomycetota bacterium]|nr:DUF2779 domain-containing protein [Actinomycetota bacterium]